MGSFTLSIDLEHMQADYVIVGSGLTGATIARTLRDCGLQVLVLERRSQISGNLYDQVHPSGIRIHSYGPHLFRTSSKKIWEWIQRFGSFYLYEHKVMTLVDGNHEHWPITNSYLSRTVGSTWRPVECRHPENFEQACLSKLPHQAYSKFVKGYTEKQWGIAANQLDASLAGRFEVRNDNDTRLKRDRYQGLPVQGYTALVSNMLKDIPVLLNCDYLKYRTAVQANKLLIFTGPIDEFFDFELGHLRYRTQKRIHNYHADIDWSQPAAVINNPDPKNGPHVRIIEWKRLMPTDYASRISGTLLTRETPTDPPSPDCYEYPFPDSVNHNLYRRYRNLALANPKLLCCGRLGEYRYFDMDQAIARALVLAQRIIRTEGLTQAVNTLQETIHDVKRTSKMVEDFTACKFDMPEEDESLETS